MSDIVQRLRQFTRHVDANQPDRLMLNEAAEEIELLRAKCRLLEADLAFNAGYRQATQRKLGDTDERVP